MSDDKRRDELARKFGGEPPEFLSNRRLIIEHTFSAGYDAHKERAAGLVVALDNIMKHLSIIHNPSTLKFSSSYYIADKALEAYRANASDNEVHKGDRSEESNSI